MYVFTLKNKFRIINSVFKLNSINCVRSPRYCIVIDIWDNLYELVCQEISSTSEFRLHMDFHELFDCFDSCTWSFWARLSSNQQLRSLRLRDSGVWPRGPSGISEAHYEGASTWWPLWDEILCFVLSLFLFPFVSLFFYPFLSFSNLLCVFSSM